jgi:hypothetical protein
VFHIGIDIDRMATDCVLVDQAEPGAAASYLMAGAMPAKDRPADGVMAGLAGLAEAAGLGQRELLARTTQFCRGTGQKQLDFKVLRIQLIGAPGPGQDQQALWRRFLMISHQLLGRREQPRREGYLKRLGFGGHSDDALAEGVVGLLTEIVWSDVLPRVSGPAPGAAVGGGYGLEPSAGAGRVPGLVWDRYASMAEVMRLLHVAGSARNVFAAFFLGEVEYGTGPVSLAVMGSPAAPVPAGEVAALAARLSAVPAGERQRLRISLFTDAAQEEIERLLAEPGADILAVWTAGTSSLAGAGPDPGTPVVRPGLPAGHPDGAAFALAPAGDCGSAETGLPAARAAVPAA